METETQPLKLKLASKVELNGKTYEVSDCYEGNGKGGINILGWTIVDSYHHHNNKDRGIVFKNTLKELKQELANLGYTKVK